MHSEFIQGIKHGIPIALGYFPVSFGFGIMAVRMGLSPITTVMISVALSASAAALTAG